MTPPDEGVGQTLRESPSTQKLNAQFQDFAHACSTFSRQVLEVSSADPPLNLANHTQLNLRLARVIFSKWSVEIAALLYLHKELGFQDIRNALGDISSSVLSTKLKRLERMGLVRREVLNTRPPRTIYSLTEKGVTASRLGQPMFLYLRLTDGLLARETEREG